MMTIELAFTEAGEVFAASQHVCFAKAGEKLAPIGDSFLRLRRDHARAHHAARGFKCQIKRRSEINIKAEGAAVLSDNLTMLEEELAVAGGEDIGRGRCGTEHVAEAVDESAFEIDTGEKRCRNALLALAQQTPCLLGGLDVAREEDYARRLQPFEQGSEARRHLGAVEADDEKLADFP